jgi:hypothetical protein
MFQAHMQWRNFTMAIPPCCYTEEVCNHMKAIEMPTRRWATRVGPINAKQHGSIHPQQEAAGIKLLIRPCVEIESMSRGPSTFIPGCTPRMLVLVLAPRTHPYSYGGKAGSSAPNPPNLTFLGSGSAGRGLVGSGSGQKALCFLGSAHQGYLACLMACKWHSYTQSFSLNVPK